MDSQPIQVGQAVPDFSLETYDPSTGDFGEISLEKMKESIRGLGLTPEDEAKVFGGNAKRILGLP